MSSFREYQKAEDRAESVLPLKLSRFPYPILVEDESYPPKNPQFVPAKAFSDLLDSFQDLLADYEELEGERDDLEESHKDEIEEKDEELEEANNENADLRSAMQEAIDCLRDNM